MRGKLAMNAALAPGATALKPLGMPSRMVWRVAAVQVGVFVCGSENELTGHSERHVTAKSLVNNMLKSAQTPESDAEPDRADAHAVG